MTATSAIPDAAFFADHRDRQTRIRDPQPGERDKEFRSLGDHNPDRRRILVWKVPTGARLMPGQILCIPFLLYADETVEDRDDVLLPILRELMMNAADDYGIDAPKGRA